MSDTITNLQWALATPLEKCLLWTQRRWPYVAIIIGTLVMLAAQVIRAFVTGRFPLR